MSGLSRRAWLLGVGAVLLDEPRRRIWELGGLPGFTLTTDWAFYPTDKEQRELIQVFWRTLPAWSATVEWLVESDHA